MQSIFLLLLMTMSSINGVIEIEGSNIIVEGSEMVFTVTNTCDEVIILQIEIPEQFVLISPSYYTEERLGSGWSTKFLLEKKKKKFVFGFQTKGVDSEMTDYYTFTVFVVDSGIINEYEQVSTNVGRYMIALIVMIFLWFIVGMDTFINKISKLTMRKKPNREQ